VVRETPFESYYRKLPWKRVGDSAAIGRFLVDEVGIEGRVFQWRHTLAMDRHLRLLDIKDHRSYNPARYDDYLYMNVLALDEGMMLMCHEPGPHDGVSSKIVWVSSIEDYLEGHDTTWPVDMEKNRTWVGKRIKKAIPLANWLSVYAHQLQETTGDIVTTGDFLGLITEEPGFNIFLSLENFQIIQMDKDWKYSGCPGLIREPRFHEYTSTIDFMAGRWQPEPDYMEALQDAEYIGYISGPFYGSWLLNHILSVTTNFEEYEDGFIGREEWDQALHMRDILHVGFTTEELFEFLCKPDYTAHTIDATWLGLVNALSDETFDKELRTIDGFFDWVERILVSYEGITFRGL
jgi:hypothetical protein